MAIFVGLFHAQISLMIIDSYYIQYKIYHQNYFKQVNTSSFQKDLWDLKWFYTSSQRRFGSNQSGGTKENNTKNLMLYFFKKKKKKKKNVLFIILFFTDFFFY